MNSDCFACKKTKVLTEEHIIPQALGGRLKAKLYCKVCNDNFGEDIDAEITNQFSKIATILVLDADWVFAGAQPQPGQHHVRLKNYLHCYKNK